MLFLATFVRKKLDKRLDVCWMSYSLLSFFLKVAKTSLKLQLKLFITR